MELMGNCLPISGHLESQKIKKSKLGLGVLERPKINRCAATTAASLVRGGGHFRS
jgi:hypothetical protein